MNHNFDIKSLPFLSEKEAKQRLQKDGYNELPSVKGRNTFKIATDILSDPMLFLLLCGGILYWILGSLEEAGLLFGFVLFVIGLTFYQERKTERALETLRNLSSPRALVIRNGTEKRIPGRDVVRGDILVLHEGDCVPADAILLYSTNFSVDESMLTGESVPVQKIITNYEAQIEPALTSHNKSIPAGLTQFGELHSLSLAKQRKLCAQSKPCGIQLKNKKIASSSNNQNEKALIFSGTLIVQGYGIAKVLEIGSQTQLGKIGQNLQSIKPEKTPLQKETEQLVKKIAIICLFLCTVLTLVFGYTRHNWLHGLLAGITTGMSILPEELPVILMIFLAIGAWRISQNQVLTRHVPVIETLGAATILCVDKTGTLTNNKMLVSELYSSHNAKFYTPSKSSKHLPEDFHPLLEYSILASQSDPFDPMEKAIHAIGNIYLAQTEHLHKDWTLIREYPLSQHLLAISHVWKSPDNKNYEIAAKGAPEAIADLCHLSKSELQALAQKIEIMASKGLRVLGVAKASFKRSKLPIKQHDFNFEFIGLIGLADPVRKNISHSVKQCYQAGIRIIMLTGDYPSTAQNIAKQIGLILKDGIITGDELEKINDTELKKRIRKTSIFARIMPEQKLRIVNALKANGEIVAMTGDGVNDAPALKAAHIGIAMGERGTDVARESASLVLLDDDFSSIVKAIRLGRRVFDNIKKAFAYTLAVHIPIAGLAIVPVFFKLPLMFFPIHIVFLEMIINPACSIIFEAESEEADVMLRFPRPPKENLFSKNITQLGILQGVSILIITLLVFIGSQYLGYPENQARALTFVLLVLTNLGLILTNRSLTKSIFSLSKWNNKALWWISSSALLLLGIILYTPFLQKLFYFTPFNNKEIIFCLVVGILNLGWLEILKKIMNYGINKA